MKLSLPALRNTPWFKATSGQWRYALRNTIAMCLALTFAYYLNLDEPYWAMTSAAVVSFPTVGGVISKSLGRIAGSLLGATAALMERRAYLLHAHGNWRLEYWRAMGIRARRINPGGDQLRPLLHRRHAV